MDNNYTKPPIGVMPKKLYKQQRMDDLKGAIDRYKEANKPIPIEWVTEYNQLVYEMRDET